MDPIRVAAVRYMNTLPLIEGLEQVEGVSFELSAPARIADLVRAGDVDIGLISVVALARPGEPLTALPVGMIGCAGETYTVRLYSKIPLDRVTRVHADADSHTSVVLARLVLHLSNGTTPDTTPFNSSDLAGASERDWPETLLLIGDKVVSTPPPAGVYEHELDLGEAWHAATGRGFVYAVWACRTADAEPDAPRRRAIELAAALLDRQRLHNATRIDAIVRASAPARGWPIDTARRYLNELLRYQFNDDARADAQTFLDQAHAAKLLPKATLRTLDAWRPAAAPG